MIFFFCPRNTSGILRFAHHVAKVTCQKQMLQNASKMLGMLRKLLAKRYIEGNLSRSIDQIDGLGEQQCREVRR